MVKRKKKISIKKQFFLWRFYKMLRDGVGLFITDKRRRNFAVGLTIFLFIPIYIIQQVYLPAGRDARDYIFHVSKGSGTNVIAKSLYNQGLIKNPFYFKLYVKIFGYEKGLRAGSFKLKPSYSLKKVVGSLVRDSGVAALIKVTIPEGYQITEIAELLESKGVVSKKRLLDYLNNKAYKNFKNKYPFLKFAANNNLEGYMFPETYYFSRVDGVEKVVDAFLKQFEKKIIPIWRQAVAIKGSPKQRFHFYEIITMASIIEKEAADKKEMKLISSVFYNRLKKRMPLGADPTIVYALGKAWKKMVTYNDLKVASPYNTYRNTGFPPTPIASFGVAAFKAALDPANTGYYFFVVNKGTNQHVFTSTYKEHLRVQLK